MNCTSARRHLLESDRLDHIAGDLADHLDTCSACRAVQRHLLRLERNIPRLPVPASVPPAALLERVLNAPVLVSPPAQLRPAIDPKAMARQKLALSMALAASLAIFTLGWWAWPHPPTPAVSPVRMAYLKKLEPVFRAAEGPEQRAEGLVGLAETWFTNVDLRDTKQVSDLAQEFRWLLRDELPQHAGQLSPGERGRVLTSLVTRLEKLESDIDGVAPRIQLGGSVAASLTRIRGTVREAHKRLHLMARDRA